MGFFVLIYVRLNPLEYFDFWHFFHWGYIQVFNWSLPFIQALSSNIYIGTNVNYVNWIWPTHVKLSCSQYSCLAKRNIAWTPVLDPIQENYLNRQSITWSNIIKTSASFLSLDGWSANHHEQLGVAPLSIHVCIIHVRLRSFLALVDLVGRLTDILYHFLYLDVIFRGLTATSHTMTNVAMHNISLPLKTYHSRFVKFQSFYHYRNPTSIHYQLSVFYMISFSLNWKKF